MMVEITLPIVLQILQTAGILVGIIYYITIMRNQQRTRELTLKAHEHTLETRQSQLFMNIYNQSFANPVFLNSVKTIHLASSQINSIEDFIEAYDYFNPNPAYPEFLEAWNCVSSFYEGLGVFVKEGLIDIRLIALTMTGITLSIWNVLEPYLNEVRERMDASRYASEWEYLVDELKMYIEEHPELET